MKTTTIISCLLTLLVFNSNAQITLSEDSVFQDPTERKAYIFQHLNLPAILWDNGVPLMDFSLFDGSDHPDLVADADVFGMAYASVFSIPKPLVEQLPNPDLAYSSEMTSISSTDDIPILALHYNYERLKPTAIDDNILYIQNDQLKNVPGNVISPFENVTSFVATPMLKKIYLQNPSFVINNEHCYGNTGKTILNANIDFGDGNGFQSMILNTPKSIFYSMPGEKQLRIKYIFSDGTSMENRCIIQVIFNPNAQNQTLNGTFEMIQTVTDPVTGLAVDILVDFNCDTDGLRKPLIFVEGFNPPELGPDQNSLPID